ncbi:MAG: hypothetical protein ACRED4_03510, partial [Brevundimonas sp.]
MTPGVTAMLGLVCGLWLMLAVGASLLGLRRLRAAATQRQRVRESEALLSALPVAPLLVGSDGTFVPDDRLSAWLGLPLGSSATFSSTSSLPSEAAQLLEDAIRRGAATGEEFDQRIALTGSSRILEVRGQAAPPAFPVGSVLLWFSDVTAREEAIEALRGDVARLNTTLHALTGLLEAAPFPMWHRG